MFYSLEFYSWEGERMKKKNSLYRTSLVGLSLTALMTGCGELKKVDDMRESTVGMGKTTTQMNNTTSQMKAKMDSLEQKTTVLSDMTDELYDTLRQGNSLQLRREAYDSVLKAPTSFKKISEAAKYFMSFEYQVWNPLGQDLESNKLNDLAQQETLEFFLEIEELAPRDGSVDPTVLPDASDIKSADNRSASFNAMAVSMHQVNRKKARATKVAGLDKVKSLYDLTEEALLTPRDKAQEGYIREILAHEEKAIQLLQARYNMFPTMLFDMVEKISEASLISKIKAPLFGWDLDLGKLNATQLEYYQTEILDQSIKAKDLLVKLGIKPVMNWKLKLLFDKMKIKASGKNSDVAVQEAKIMEKLKNIREAAGK